MHSVITVTRFISLLEYMNNEASRVICHTDPLLMNDGK